MRKSVIVGLLALLSPLACSGGLLTIDLTGDESSNTGNVGADNIGAPGGDRFDENGNRINADGNRINENGDLIDEDGNLINENGDRIDEEGNLVDENGDPIPPEGGIEGSDGQTGEVEFCGENVCTAGQTCVDEVCVTDCGSTDLCGQRNDRCCPAEAPVCVFGQFCQAACDQPEQTRCGSDGAECCGEGFICGDSLSCVRECAPNQELCGTGTPESFGSTCCNPGDSCVFDACTTPGTACTTFLDCDNGEYCELVLDADPNNPDPNRGLCLTDAFPEDVPVCQARPDDILLPRTEWRWTGVQIRNEGDLFAGQIIPPCEDPADEQCYVYPCPNYDSGNDCWNNVESNPVVADLDHAVAPDGTTSPEVVVKAYRDGAFITNNIIVVLDGRDGTTLQVYYNDTRGHLAVANMDADPQLEIASLGGGLKVYEPFPNCETRAELECESDALCLLDGPNCERSNQSRKWFSNDSAASLNRNFWAGAPALTDFDKDGNPEIVVSTAVVDAATGTTLVNCPADGGGNNDGEQWYISVIADIDLDNIPEIISGNRAYEIKNDPGGAGWTCTEDWRAQFDDDGTSNLGAGFPGIGNFIDNQDWPYAPEPAIECTSLAEGECSGDCTWNATQNQCLYSASHACARLADEDECNAYLACKFDTTCVEDTDQTTLFPVDKDYPETVTTRDGRVFITHGKTGRVMKSPANGSVNLFFDMFVHRGGAPNVADFDGDGRVEVSFANTGCVAVFDLDCAVETAEERLGEFTTDVQTHCGDANAWQHRLCYCTTESSAECDLCNPTTGDPTLPECLDLPPGCGKSPRESHGPNYLTSDGDLACTNNADAQKVREQLGVLWMRRSQDASSAATGTSVFDFQGDGKAEVLYGDECFFRVYNGENGSLLYERPNSHRTASEYPIVVDVDGDSQSEVVVVSNSDKNSRDKCGGDEGSDRAFRQDAGTYELYTPEFCSCGNYDVCAGLAEEACNSTTGCGFDTECAPLNCADITDSGLCNENPACEHDGAICQRSNLNPATQCNLADGCAFDEGTGLCEPWACASFTDETSCTEIAPTESRVGCEWTGSACRESPRHPNYICQNATFGVTVIGDTRDQWVRTLPYWHQHSYHVTEIDRDGNPVADWGDNLNNWDVYNNYRQNVQGFVPLNAPDLQIFSLNASLADCPTRVRLAARVVNRGRAGIQKGTPVQFFIQQGGELTLVDEVGLPFSILPGQGADVTTTATLADFGDPLFFSFMVVANPQDEFEPVFECNGDNNQLSTTALTCLDGGG